MIDKHSCHTWPARDASIRLTKDIALPPTATHLYVIRLAKAEAAGAERNRKLYFHELPRGRREQTTGQKKMFKNVNFMTILFGITMKNVFK